MLLALVSGWFVVSDSLASDLCWGLVFGALFVLLVGFVRKTPGVTHLLAAVKAAVRRAILHLEVLEDRCCPTTFIWNPRFGSNDWQKAGNWDINVDNGGNPTGLLPGLGDTVRFEGSLSQANCSYSGSNKIAAEIGTDDSYTGTLSLNNIVDPDDDDTATDVIFQGRIITDTALTIIDNDNTASNIVFQASVWTGHPP